MEARLVGVHKVTVKLADGSTETYYYAWRGKGAPRMISKPGTKAFTLEYVRLTKDRPRKAQAGTLDTLIDDFHASREFQKLKPKTRAEYERQIGLIRAKFGTLPIQAIEARGSRKMFIAWRDAMADTPRAADLAIGLLARIFAWAFKNEIVLRNPLTELDRLHSGSRKNIIWSADQLHTLLTLGKPHIRDVALMALWTMQRQADLLTMPTIAYDGERLMVKQAKTGARLRIAAAPAIRPILDAAQKAGRQRVLVNSFGQNWTSTGFKSSWRKEIARLGISGVTFHDLRGTAISFAYANLDRPHDEKIRLIAEISGHSEKDAESIIRRHYLAGSEVIDAIGRGTERK